MKVIFLKGRHNCGKTTTLNLLYDALKENSEIIEPRRELPGREDFECVLKYDNKKIAIFSLGDYWFAPGAAIGYYAKAKCDILVVAYSLGKYIHNNELFKLNSKQDPEIGEKEGLKDEEALKKLIEKIG